MKLSLTLSRLAAVTMLLSVVICKSSGQESGVLYSPKDLKLIGVRAEATSYRGRQALHITEDTALSSGIDQELALISGTDIENGIIEVDVAGMPAKDAPDVARGFVGVVFRSTDDGSRFECFYLRPTNGRADDQLRRNHSLQYISQPAYPWERLRQESPGVYESYADLQAGEWAHIRIQVDGARALLYVNGATEPSLVVNDLKLGLTHGGIGLWIGLGTDAYFSNLRIERTSRKNNAASPEAQHPAGRETPEGVEAKLGDELVHQYSARSGLSPTPELKEIQAYIQKVGDRLASHASQPLAYRFHLDPNPAFKSAFALPGENIIIGGGILAFMKTEDELAAVLAHEIIHIDEGQVAQRTAQLMNEHHLAMTEPAQWNVDDFGRTYTDEQELTCDRDGAKLEAKAGYSPLGMLHLLQTFQLVYHPRSVPSPTAMLSRRVQQIESEIKEQKWQELKESPLDLP